MRFVLLLSLLMAAVSANAQTPAKPQPTPTTPTPPPQTKPQTSPPAAQPRPQQPARRPAQPAARSGIAMTVTDPAGATIAGVRVELLGGTERAGETNESGQINFPGLQAGTYRVRFSGEEVITFEREVTLRAGQVVDLDITLNPAPPPKVVTVPGAPAPEPSAPAAPSAAPAGQPLTLSVVDLLDKEFVGRQPRRETLLSCSGTMRTTMIQLNEPQPERRYESAETTYYVLGGEGAIRINGRETRLETNGFVSVPRGATHSFTRRGNRPLVLLATLSGAPCEETR